MRIIRLAVSFVFALLVSASSADAVPLNQANTANAPWQNAPWQNAPWQNAPWQNAPWQNAPWQNAPWQNSPWQNAPWQNAAIANVFFPNTPIANAPWQNDNTPMTPWASNVLWNGPLQNAPWQNAPWQNAEWANAPWQNAPWQNAPWQNAEWANAPWQNAPFMFAEIINGEPIDARGVVGAHSDSCPRNGVVPHGAVALGGYLNGTELVGFDGERCVRGDGFIGTVFAIPRPDDTRRHHWFKIADVRTPVSGYENGRWVGDMNLMAYEPENHNDDVWLYRVQAMTCSRDVDPCPSEDVTWTDVCGGDPDNLIEAFGVFISGFFSADMTYLKDTTITPACRRGTIAKALIDMGYKPYKTYTSRVTGQPVSGELLWLTAAAALMAHYNQASTGLGITRAGTPIDLRDAHGLVLPATNSHSSFAAAAESTWSNGGSETYTQFQKGHAHVIFSARYPDLDSSTFNNYLNSATYDAANGAQFFTNNASGAMPHFGPTEDLIQIESGVLCTHEPNVEGRALSPFCNACAAKVCDSDPNTLGWQDDLGCCRVSGDGAHDWLTETNTWSYACMMRARTICSVADGLLSGDGSVNAAPTRSAGTDVTDASFVEDVSSPCVYVGALTQGWEFSDEGTQNVVFALEQSPSFDVLNPDAITPVAATFHQNLFDLPHLNTFCVRPKANVSSTSAAPATINLIALDTGGQTKLLRVPLRFNVREKNDAPTVAGWQTSTLVTNEDSSVNLGEGGATFSAGPGGTFASTETAQTLSYTATLTSGSGSLRRGSQPLGAGGSFLASELGSLTFVPAANWSGSASVLVRATDNGLSWNGSTLAADARNIERSRSITVNAQNDLPTVVTAGVVNSAALLLYSGVASTPAFWSTKPMWTDVEDGTNLSYRILEVPGAYAKILPATGTTALGASTTITYTIDQIRDLRTKAGTGTGSGWLRIEGRDSSGATFIAAEARISTISAQ